KVGRTSSTSSSLRDGCATPALRPDRKSQNLASGVTSGGESGIQTETLPVFSTSSEKYGEFGPAFRRSLVLLRSLRSDYNFLAQGVHSQSAPCCRRELPRLDARRFRFLHSRLCAEGRGAGIWN